MSHAIRNVESLETTAIFFKAFEVPGLSEVLPAGEYAVQVELRAPPGCADPGRRKASVLVQLHPTQGIRVSPEP